MIYLFTNNIDCYLRQQINNYCIACRLPSQEKVRCLPMPEDD